MTGSLEVRPSLPPPESLLWRISDQSSTLEQAKPSQDIAVELINRYMAIQELKHAKAQAQILDKNHKPERLLDIAAAQAEIGENPNGTLAIIEGIIRDSYITGSDLLLARASKIAAYVGDTERALGYAEKASRKRESWPFMGAADVLAAKGLDPAIFLDKAAEIGNSNTKPNYPGLKILEYTELATGMKRHDRDPQPWLDKANVLIQTVKDDDLWAYEKIAVAYAQLGNFYQAKNLVEKIDCTEPDQTQEAKARALAFIAYRQVEVGYIDEAVQLAMDLKHRTTLPNILFKVAEIQVANGLHPETTLFQAIELLKQKEKDLYFDPPYELAKSYSTAGRILATHGKDPSEMFEKARKQAATIEYDNHQSEAYRQLSRNMFSIGVDVHTILDEALILEKTKQIPSPWMLGQILQTALECEYYEYFDPILKRLKNYEIYYDRTDYVSQTWREIIRDYNVIFLVKHARALGKNSLTRGQIANLDSQTIKDIRKNGPSRAKVALKYFRFAD